MTSLFKIKLYTDICFLCNINQLAQKRLKQSIFINDYDNYILIIVLNYRYLAYLHCIFFLND